MKTGWADIRRDQKKAKKIQSLKATSHSVAYCLFAGVIVAAFIATISVMVFMLIVE